MGRAPCCEKVGLKRGRWTTEEDDILLKYIQTNGEGSWRSLPKNAGLLRCGKSCRLRWINYLRADLKRGNISQEEESTIIKLHGSFGNKWSLIAAQLPGRTDNEIKNYWNSHLSRRIYSFKRVNSDGVYVAMDMEMNKIMGGCKRKGGRTSRLAMKKNKSIERLRRETHEKSGGNLSIMEKVKQKEERESMALLGLDEDSGNGFVGSNEGGVESEVMSPSLIEHESRIRVFCPSEERESEISGSCNNVESGFIWPNGMVEDEIVGSNEEKETWVLGFNEERESVVSSNNEERESQILGVKEDMGGDREGSSCDMYTSLSNNCFEEVGCLQDELVGWDLEGIESASRDLEGANTKFWKDGDDMLSWLWEDDEFFKGESLWIEECDKEKSYAAWLMSTDENAV